MSEELDCALDLLRRLPPQNIERDLSNLVNLAPDLYEELLSSVDQPLKVRFIDLTIFSPGLNQPFYIYHSPYIFLLCF